MGNLRSVEKALEHVGVDGDDHQRRRRRSAAADGLILPGVGAFPRAMERIRELGLDELIAERRDGRRADPRHLPRPAAALRLDHRARRRRRASACSPARSASSTRRGLKVPHIGWSPVRWERESRLTEGIESETPFYFVHSFAPQPERGRAARHRRLRRPLRLRGRARQRLRRPVPPREVERRRPAPALQLRRGLRPCRCPA